jgi:hypothetical protein
MGCHADDFELFSVFLAAQPLVIDEYMRFICIATPMLAIAACSKYESSDEVLSSERVARAFAEQARFATEQHLAGKTTPTFDSVYFHYLDKTIQNELATESKQEALGSDTSKRNNVLNAVRSTDSIVRAIASSLHSDEHIKPFEQRLESISVTLHAMDTQTAR